MPSIRTTFLTMALVALAERPAAAQGPARWCHGDLQESWMIGRLRQALTATDSAGVQARRIFALPAVPPDSIRMVTDERVCERAARVYYRFRLGPMPGGVEVARVTDRYYVYGRNRAGEWTIMSVFTAQFHELANVAM
jgi:hypothetical protein